MLLPHPIITHIVQLVSNRSHHALHLPMFLVQDTVAVDKSRAVDKSIYVKSVVVSLFCVKNIFQSGENRIHIHQ